MPMRLERIATLGLSRFAATLVGLAVVFAGYAFSQIYTRHSWRSALWAILIAVALLGALFLEPTYSKLRDRMREKQRRPEISAGIWRANLQKSKLRL